MPGGEDCVQVEGSHVGSWSFLDYVYKDLEVKVLKNSFSSPG